MLHKTRGIVFKTTKYSETSVIAKIYTENFGVQSYMVNGIRSTKSKNKAALLQPGNILDMVVYYRENKNLQRIKEFKSGFIYTSTTFDVVKSSILLFCVEVLNKAIQEEESNEPLFEFISNAFERLDNIETSAANFHLWFMTQLSGFLGFFPNGCFSTSTPYFDLLDGTFFQELKAQQYFLEPPLSRTFSTVLENDFEEIMTLKIAGNERKALLHHLVDYYRLHIESFGKMHSPAILQEVLK